MIKQWPVLLTTILCVALLTSCGKKDAVKTVDASVEYQSAKSLPPLQHKENVLSGTTSIAPEITSFDGQVLNDNKGSYVVINSRGDSAWNQLEAGLYRANITVYGRNKEAGMFFISCGDEPVTTIEKRKPGALSIFKGKRNFIEKEYCFLYTTPARQKKTAVTFMSRDGYRVISNYSKEIYSRLVSN